MFEPFKQHTRVLSFARNMINKERLKKDDVTKGNDIKKDFPSLAINKHVFGFSTFSEINHKLTKLIIRFLIPLFF